MPTHGFLDCPHGVEDCLVLRRFLLALGVTQTFKERIRKTKFTLLTVFSLIVACVALGSLPPPTFAQRGGHGGGGRGSDGGVAGGFHAAGGGHYSYTGGHSYGGYRGYYGRHGSYRWYGGYGWQRGSYGWHRGYWGYSRYGWGWGFGFGFGWPYWGWGYPYGYGYSPWYYAPYPYYCPPGYRCPRNGNDDPPHANPSPKSGSNPAKPWGPPLNSPNKDHSTSNLTTVASRAPLLAIDPTKITATSYRIAHSTTPQNPGLRPEMQSAMRALREMPPFAREREIETGRYGHFSPEERELLRSAN